MRSRRSLLAGVAALILAATAAAETRHLKADFDAVVAAERAFSRLSEEKGFKESFLANIADDGVMFSPEPRPGKEWLGSRPDPSIQLVWWPADAGIARSGRGEASAPYMRVWEKCQDGSWKIVLEVGKLQEPPPAQKPAS